MKRLVAFLAAAVLLTVMSAAVAQTAGTLIKGELKRNIPLKADYPDNPVVPGTSSTTGLPFTGVYVPIVEVLGNTPQARPHIGVGQADVMYQMPNAGAGSTKFVALFADQTPQLAGGSRSARVPFIDVAYEWGAAFLSAGTPGNRIAEPANVPAKFKQLGMAKAGLVFDLLGTKGYGERVKGIPAPHNLMGHIAQIKQMLIDKGLTFKERPFLFTDGPQAGGIPAQVITIKHYGEKVKKQSNPSSDSTFTYEATKNAYLRSDNSGPYVDRDAPGVQLAFANVIVQRVKFDYRNGDYVFLPGYVGSGAAEIFTNGKYIAGAWVHKTAESRTVFVDEQGNEIALQRGKTFIIVTNDISEVFYQ